MKKSGKILIVVLCLIILGLATFIVVDKLILTKKYDKSINEESNTSQNATNNVESNVNNQIANNEGNRTETSGNNKIGNKASAEEAKIDDSANTSNKGNKTIKSVEDIDDIVADYNHVSRTSGYMKVTAFDLNSNVIWTYKTETIEGHDWDYKLEWFHTDRAYVIVYDHVIVLDALTGNMINDCKFPKDIENDSVDVLATTINTEKGYYYALVRHDYFIEESSSIIIRDVLYKIDDRGIIVSKANINSNGAETIYDGFAQEVSVTKIDVDSSEKVLTCNIKHDTDIDSSQVRFDIDFK